MRKSNGLKQYLYLVGCLMDGRADHQLCFALGAVRGPPALSDPNDAKELNVEY